MTANAAVGRDAQYLQTFPEAPLLRQEDLARWSGLKLGYFVAANRTRGHRWAEYPSVGLITQGAARWSVRCGLTVTETHVSAGTAGLFGTDFEFDRSAWTCRDARRVIVETDHSDYQRFDLEDELLKRPLRHRFAVPDPDVAALLAAMVSEIAAGCPHGKLYGESLSLGLLRHLHNVHGEPRSDSAKHPSRRLTTAQVARLREFIRDNVAAELSLVDLAKVAGVSTAHFASMFRDTLGVTPHRYVLGERIGAARRLLAMTQTSLIEVALATGFSSQSHFTTAFARDTGVTPGVYRQRVRE